MRTKGASVGSTHTLEPIPTTRDKPNLVRGTGAPASSSLISELGTPEAVDSGPPQISQRALRRQRSASQSVQASQGSVFRALQELDETTRPAIHLERPEVRSDFTGQDGGCGDRVPVTGTLR